MVSRPARNFGNWSSVQSLSMNFSTRVIAFFLLDFQGFMFGLEQTTLVVLGAVLAVVEVLHHLVVFLGQESL